MLLRSSLALLRQLRLSPPPAAADDLLLLNSSHLVSGLQHQRQQHSDAPAAAGDDSGLAAASEAAVPQQQQLAATSPSAAVAALARQRQAAAELRQRPFLPTHLVLQAVRDTSEAPLNSHQLYAYVQQQYGGPFTSRAEFKQNLKHVQKKRWVSARPVPPAAGADAAAAAGGKAGSKRRKKAQAAEANFVFTLTPGGKRQDLDSRGSDLDVAARAAADEWTRQHMPAYMQALAEGRLPVTLDNMDLLLEPPQQQQQQQ